jgi:hypothetical protein
MTDFSCGKRPAQPLCLCVKKGGRRAERAERFFCKKSGGVPSLDKIEDFLSFYILNSLLGILTFQGVGKKGNQSTDFLRKDSC